MKIYLVKNKFRYKKISSIVDNLEVYDIEKLSDVLTYFLSRYEKSVVIIDSFGRFAILGVIACILLKSKFVIRVRGDVIREYSEKANKASTVFERLRLEVSRYIKKKCLSLCDAVVYNSHHTRKRLRPFVGSGAAEAVVHNPFTGLNSSDSSGEPNQLPDGHLRLLTVTNMNLEKKVRPTVQAIKDWIPTSFWNEFDVRWAVLGDGKYIGDLKDTVRTEGLMERVIITGWVDEPLQFYEWCDVYVHLTLIDAFPNATMEAMSRCRPVVTNEKSCGVREQVFDGENGFVVKGGDEFTSRLRRYALDPDLCRDHGRTGARLVGSKWSIEAQREKMTDFIRNITSDIS